MKGKTQELSISYKSTTMEPKHLMTAIAVITASIVSCKSLPADIEQGINAGTPHAYYEAGKHIDNTKTVNEAPPAVRALCFPADLCLLPANIFIAGLAEDHNDFPTLESCFYYRCNTSRNREAAKYYSKGAELGDADCLYEMARNYENGWGVSKDVNKARAYYAQAARKGNKAALASIQAPASISGKRLNITSNTGWNGLDSVVKDGELLSNDSHGGFYMEYKKTGEQTATLTLTEAGSGGFFDTYYLNFTDSSHAVITQGTSGDRFSSAPLKDIRGSISVN